MFMYVGIVLPPSELGGQRHKKKGEKLDCSDSTCKIVPSVVQNQILQNMRHQRYCHILKGFVGNATVVVEILQVQI